eukprot:SAG11_NODE_501_length_8895_cov_12.129832_5_plen_71_part_00
MASTKNSRIVFAGLQLSSQSQSCPLRLSANGDGRIGDSSQLGKSGDQFYLCVLPTKLSRHVMHDRRCIGL